MILKLHYIIYIYRIQTEEDKLLQAACTILYTVPRAIEHYIDREYKGGFIQAIRDFKDQLKTELRPEEWDLLSRHIGTLLTYLTQCTFSFVYSVLCTTIFLLVFLFYFSHSDQ